MADAEMIRVEVVYALADHQDFISLTLPAGSSAAEAVRASGLIERWPELADLPPLAVFGRLMAAETLLRDGDRVELLRALQTDPKQRRRERVQAVRQRRRR